MESLIIAFVTIMIWVRYLVKMLVSSKNEVPKINILSDSVVNYVRGLKIVEVTYRKPINYDRLLEAGCDVISVHLSRPIDRYRTLLTYTNLKIDQIIRNYRGSRMVIVLNGEHYPSDLNDWRLVEEFDNVEVWVR
jgi:hypothetical protein